MKLLLSLLVCIETVLICSTTTTGTNKRPLSASQSSCTISTRNGFGTPSPIPLNGNEMMIPNVKTGQLSIGQDQQIELFCSGDFELKATKSVMATCIAGQQFQVPGLAKANDIKELVCKTKSKVVLKNTSTNGNIKYGTVGLEKTATDFVPVYDTCFDTSKEGALYSHFTMTRAILHSQLTDRPTYFSEDSCFTCSCNELYKKTNHKKTICGDILKIDETSTMCTKLFSSGQKYLAKGHLAANADFLYEFQQASTFKLCNAVPQWQNNNNGNWKTLEDNVRKYAGGKEINLDIYTGAIGVLQLPDVNNNLVDISLDVSGKVPVPKLMYKIVIDKVAKKGVAFVMINNPLTLSSTELTDYMLCNDIMSTLTTWQTYRSKTANLNSFTKGYMYACPVNADFLKHAPELPQQDILAQVRQGVLI